MTSYPNKLVKASFPLPAVLLLSLNRKPVNALNDAFWEELKLSFELAGRDPDVRCIVFASDLDKIFTAGLDLTQSTLTTMVASDPGRTALLLKDHIKHLQDCVSSIEVCRAPVVAAVHGLALGGALDLLAACDVRFAASNSIFSIKEVDVGLAADVGSLQRLPPKIGSDSLLRELALTARNFGAEEALKLGFVSKVVEGGREAVLDAALETARIIASKSPIATVGTKHLLNYSRDHTVQEGLDYTAIWNSAMLQAQDLTSAFTAFATKKPASYKNLAKL